MGEKLDPKVILEGARLPSRTAIAFVLDDHRRIADWLDETGGLPARRGVTSAGAA